VAAISLNERIFNAGLSMGLDSVDVDKDPKNGLIKLSVGTEDIVAVGTFILALIFLVFIGSGWLANKATTSQFMQSGSAVISGFIGLITSIVEAKKDNKDRGKNRFPYFIPVFFLAIAVISGIALYRTF
jgi:hypothetical protein